MSNHRKPRPATKPFSAVTHVDRGQPRPGERCQYHPGCCEEDDTTCPGCGDQAIGAITFRRQHETAPARRVAYCTEHAGFIADAVVQMLQQQDVALN